MKIGDRVFVHGIIDEIRKDCVIIRNNGGYFGTIESEIIPKPSAQPERKKGKWINRWSGDGSTWLEEKCSECGIVFEDEPHEYNFCPNCGARMDEE